MDNLRPLIIDRLTEYFKDLPEYSIGDILYSTISQLTKGRPEIKKSDLRKITDEMFYSALDKSLAKERPETEKD